MSDTDLLVAMVAAFFFLIPGLFGAFIGFNRWRYRNHFWFKIDLANGRTIRPLEKPDEKGLFHTKWGVYWTSPTAFKMDDGGIRWGLKPEFRYLQGDPRPVVYVQDYVASANPGKLEKVSVAAHQTVPAESLEIAFNQHLFSDVYASKLGLVVALILFGFVILGIIMAGLYVKR
jgi:hypothetical protein